MFQTNGQAGPPPAVAALWRHLPRLRCLALTATAGPGSTTGWAGHGQARVTASAEKNTIRLFENGVFTCAITNAQVSFRNVYRWQARGARLSLSHERFGSHAPVWLFDLVAEDQDALVAAQPHRCGQDDYTARLRLVADGMALTWRITGPRKNETLRYCYCFAAA